MKQQGAAFFDVDRTVVTANTGGLYLRWRYARGEASLRDVIRVASWIVQYSAGVLDAEALAHRGVKDVAGYSESQFRAELQEWYRECVRPRISLEARREIARRRQAGQPIVLLSASTEYAVGPLAEDLDISHVLCTQLESVDGQLTGACTDLCYGSRKVEIAEAWAADNDIDLGASVFFSDSISDLPMLERVGEARIINPDPRLRLHALRKGWPIELWR